MITNSLVWAYPFMTFWYKFTIASVYGIEGDMVEGFVPKSLEA
jgi:hypothetical protein